MLILDYVKMIFLDTLVANPDRHTFNYGILRNSENGNIIGFAPNFDNNRALISRGYPKNIKRKNDILVKCLNELFDYKPNLKKYVSQVNENILHGVLKEFNMRVKSKIIIEFIMNGYNGISR